MPRESESGRMWRTDWQVMKEQLFEPLARELRPLAADMDGPTEDHAVELTFEELTERTHCREHPNGMDFSSDPKSYRHFLYDNRVEIADEFIIYYTSIYGVGIKFTANPLLGLKWKEEYELERAHSLAGTTEALWQIAKGQVPRRLRASCDWFLHRSAERRAIVARIQREGRSRYLQLERGEGEAGKTP